MGLEGGRSMEADLRPSWQGLGDCVLERRRSGLDLDEISDDLDEHVRRGDLDLGGFCPSAWWGARSGDWPFVNEFVKWPAWAISCPSLGLGVMTRNWSPERIGWWLLVNRFPERSVEVRLGYFARQVLHPAHLSVILPGRRSTWSSSVLFCVVYECVACSQLKLSHRLHMLHVRFKLQCMGPCWKRWDFVPLGVFLKLSLSLWAWNGE